MPSVQTYVQDELDVCMQATDMKLQRHKDCCYCQQGHYSRGRLSWVTVTSGAGRPGKCTGMVRTWCSGPLLPVGPWHMCSPGLMPGSRCNLAVPTPASETRVRNLQASIGEQEGLQDAVILVFRSQTSEMVLVRLASPCNGPLRP
jgi:hypothetical protein